MKLEIEITRQDYLDFNIFHYIRKRLPRSIITCLVALAVIQFYLYKDKTHVDVGLIVVTSILYVVFYFFFIYRSLRKTRNTPKEDGAMLGKKELEFTDDQIICTGRDSSSQYKWSAVKSLEESKKAFYLYLDTNMGIVIPKRSFKDTAEQQSYRQFIQERLNIPEQLI